MTLRAKINIVAVAAALAVSAPVLLVLLAVRRSSTLLNFFAAPAYFGMWVSLCLARIEVMAWCLGFTSSFTAWFLLARGLATGVARRDCERWEVYVPAFLFAVIWVLGILTTLPWGRG